jgi:hypothetical protein
MLSSQHKEETGRKGYIVKEIIDVLIPYGRQNIVIGGHRYSPVVSLALTKPRNSSRGITLPPVHSTNLTFMR